jgi:hypothetical protein
MLASGSLLASRSPTATHVRSDVFPLLSVVFRSGVFTNHNILCAGTFVFWEQFDLPTAYC